MNPVYISEGYNYIEARSKNQPNLVYLVYGKFSKKGVIAGEYKVLTYASGRVPEYVEIYSLGNFPSKDFDFTLSDKTF